MHVRSDDDRHGGGDFDAVRIDDVDFIKAVCLAVFRKIRLRRHFVGAALVYDFQCVGHQKVVKIIVEGDEKVLLGGFEERLRFPMRDFRARMPD